MIKKLLILPLLLATLLAAPFVAAPLSVVAVSDEAQTACNAITSAGGQCSTTNSGASGLIRSVINILSIIVGAVSVIMIIIGGFRYVISGGDSNGTSGAKNTILYALIGLVITISAQVIVRFVFTNANANVPAPDPQACGNPGQPNC